MPHDIRAKLSALHDDLARESKPTLSIISTDGLSAKREMGGHGSRIARVADATGRCGDDPGFVLEADHFLRAALFEDTLPDVYWHRLEHFHYLYR